jgi:ribosomal protein S13
MSKAREICNQIEVLFLELSAVSGELSEAEAARIKDYIEQKQLLLKIELLKKELQDNEV